MRWLALLLLATLAGCGASDARPNATKRWLEQRKARIEAAQVRLAKTPLPRTYRYADGELRVLQIPSADGSGFVEEQQCYVWRDEVYKTASISCSVPPVELPPEAYQGPEKER
jgi:hypothetical protein